MVTEQPEKMVLKDAVAELLSDFGDNSWFLNHYWPVNESRVKMIVQDLVRYPGSSILDVGCGNGYISLLLSKLGYEVTAADAWRPADQVRLFKRYDIPFMRVNLNEPDPLRGRYDVVLMGEVIEHILGCPLDLMCSSRKACLQTLILTTPNPATFINSIRLAQGRYAPWGTREFMSEQKFGPEGVITKAEIHYREYLPSDLRWLIEQAGFVIEAHRFFPFSSASDEGRIKRIAKRLIPKSRLFGANQYIVAH